MSTQSNSYQAIIIGGGHNGLVAACYLAKAGVKTLILEANSQVGGATVSQKVFPDYEAKLSRYSYLVSLLPDQIVNELGLNFETLRRDVASFTPTKIDGKDIGLLVTTGLIGQTEPDFKALTGASSEFKAWKDFYEDVQKLADAIAPTMLAKLPTRSELKNQVNHRIWDEIMERPIGQVIEARFENDLVRGIVLTDGLIGTHSDAHDMQANICFLYHLIGNGEGYWKVPRGGMGALVSELTRLATSLGVDIKTDSRVKEVVRDGSGYNLTTTGGAEYLAQYVLANCAPQALAKIMGQPAPASLDGSQVKINMLLKKLPRLKSGQDPKMAFAGTFHFDENYSDLQKAFTESSAGKIPTKVPAEMYCHTLSDTTILGDDLVSQGYQTLTLFGIHTPAALFEADNEGTKKEIQRRLLSQLNEYLVDPIEECLATALDGSLCIEIKSPLDLERDVDLPRGNIFHKDLSMPFREDASAPSWGVETQFPNIFICGAGAIRGGGVSGIPGHNAAMAVLEQI